MRVTQELPVSEDFEGLFRYRKVRGAASEIEAKERGWDGVPPGAEASRRPEPEAESGEGAHRGRPRKAARRAQ